MTRRWNGPKNQKEIMISKWEYLVALYRKAKQDSSLRQWGKFIFEMSKFTARVILMLILKKIIRHFFEDFWSDSFGDW